MLDGEVTAQKAYLLSSLSIDEMHDFKVTMLRHGKQD